jgi:uncharacterized protein (TIGR02266 family)
VTDEPAPSAEPHLDGKTDIIAPPGEANPEALVGHSVKGFRLDAVLGQDGFSVVYRGEQIALRRQVAVRVLKSEFGADLQRIQDFLEAGRAAASLLHPGLVKVYDVGSTEEGVHLIAREFVPGTTLARRLVEGPLPQEETIRMGVELARALEYAHANDHIHGCVAPEAVLFDAEGTARLVGGGHRIRLEPGWPETKEEVAEVLCQPPEQILDGTRDARVDVYALGAVLYMSLTGMPPYPADLLASAVRDAKSVTRAELRSALPTLHADLANLVEEMIALMPEERPGSMTEVREDLEGIEFAAAEQGNASPEEIVLRKTRELGPADRRRYRRLRTDMDVAIAPREATHETASYFLSKASNLGENGAFVTTSKPMPVGSFVDLEFTLAGKGSRVKVFGVVRWIERQKEGGGMGVQFLEVSTTDRKNLRAYVDDQISEEMSRVLTSSQLHRAILKHTMRNFGNELTVKDFASVTGAGRQLLLRALKDFTRFGLLRLNGDRLEAVQPESLKLLHALEDALMAH